MLHCRAIKIIERMEESWTRPARLRNFFKPGKVRLTEGCIDRRPFCSRRLEILGPFVTRAFFLGKPHVDLIEALDLKMLIGLVRRAIKNHTAAVDENDLVEQVGPSKHMRRTNHSAIVRRKATQDLHQRELRGRIQSGGRFVQEEHSRLVEQLSRDAHPFALPSGKLKDPLVTVFAETETLDRFIDQNARWVEGDARIQT